MSIIQQVTHFYSRNTFSLHIMQGTVIFAIFIDYLEACIASNGVFHPLTSEVIFSIRN